MLQMDTSTFNRLGCNSNGACQLIILNEFRAPLPPCLVVADIVRRIPIFFCFIVEQCIKILNSVNQYIYTVGNQISPCCLGRMSIEGWLYPADFCVWCGCSLYCSSEITVFKISVLCTVTT